MKRVLGILMVLILCPSCNILLNTDNGAAPRDADCSDFGARATRILFIGNTYTSYNDLPKVFKDLACSKGAKTEIYAMTVQNYRFLNHTKDQATLDLIDFKLWDYVILQNHGQVPSFKPSVMEKTSLPYAKELAQKIYTRFEGTEIIYLQTWGRLDGDQSNCVNYVLVCDLVGHTQALEDGYQMYADETDGKVALVGNAFLEIYNDKNSPIDPADLWHQDGAHPSFAGTYLAASVLFAKIYNSSPEGAMLLESLGQQEAQYLQEIAAKYN